MVSMMQPASPSWRQMCARGRPNMHAQAGPRRDEARRLATDRYGRWAGRPGLFGSAETGGGVDGAMEHLVWSGLLGMWLVSLLASDISAAREQLSLVPFLSTRFHQNFVIG